MSNERSYDSPPPHVRIPAGQYRRPSFPPGPPGYLPYEPPEMPFPYYGSTPQDQVLVAGACPACRIGRLENEYSYATLCCICFMPFAFGKHRKCDNCGAYFY